MLARLVYAVVSDERLCLKQGRARRLTLSAIPPQHMSAHAMRTHTEGKFF